MYYRVTRVSHSAENRQAMIDLLNEKQDELKAFEGLRYVRLLAVSDTETVAVSEYKTQEALDAVEERFSKVMAAMVPLMSGIPEVQQGPSFWELVLDAD